MKRSNRLVILVGVLLAILAFVAIVILLNNQRQEASVPPEEVKETVLVATEDIDIGEEVTPDKVEEQQVDPEAVQGTALRSATQVGGQRALFAVPAGAQVTAELVGLGRDSLVDISAQLQPGEKAIAVRVDEQSGVGFLVQPGDTVDVIISAQVDVLQPTADSLENPDAPTRFEPVQGLEATRSVKAVLQDKRVLYVSGSRADAPEPQDTNGDGVIDANDAPPAQEAIESVVIVFAGTAQDAEAVKWAQRDRSELSSERTEIATSISVIVRSDDDDAIEETVGVTIDSMVTEYGLRIPAIVEQLNEEAAP